MGLECIERSPGHVYDKEEGPYEQGYQKSTAYTQSRGEFTVDSLGKD